MDRAWHGFVGSVEAAVAALKAEAVASCVSEGKGHRCPRNGRASAVLRDLAIATFPVSNALF
jgi:hypothetical protein